MEELFKAPLYVLSFVIITIGTERADAQEFRGFCGNNSKSYSGKAPRNYKPNYLKNYRNRRANSSSFYCGGIPPINVAGAFIPPFQGFYPSPYLPASIVINILPASNTPLRDTYNRYNAPNRYRNNWDDLRTNPGRDYSYSSVDYVIDGNQMVKINGDWFYEVEGNYYRADNTQKLSNRNTRLVPYDMNLNINRYGNDDMVVYVTGRNSSSNATYISGKKQPAKTVKVFNKYDGANAQYADADIRQVSNALLLLHKEQELLKVENMRLREATQQRLAIEKQVRVDKRKRNINENKQAEQELFNARKRNAKEMEAERKRQIQAQKQAEQELNNMRKRNAKEINAVRKRQIQEHKKAEQELNNARMRNAEELAKARRDQIISERKWAEEQEEANKKYEKRRAEAAENNDANNELFSSLKIGDRVDQIPKNSKVVKIDGKKTYVSPRNFYYRKQQGKYRVVGISG